MTYTYKLKENVRAALLFSMTILINMVVTAREDFNVNLNELKLDKLFWSVLNYTSII